MHRFIDQALLGLADEDNGESKVTGNTKQGCLRWCRIRRTATAGPLTQTADSRSSEANGVISHTTMSRLLKRLHIRLSAQTDVGCPGKRRMKRLREIRARITTCPRTK
jgi:hypothetical protein